MNVFCLAALQHNTATAAVYEARRGMSMKHAAWCTRGTRAQGYNEADVCLQPPGTVWLVRGQTRLCLRLYKPLPLQETEAIHAGMPGH